jgi:hypothetical protein
MKCYKIWDAADVYYATRKPRLIMAVVAHSSTEARQLFWRDALFELDMERFVDIRIKFLPHVNVSRFTKPQVLSNKAGLRLGAYTQAEGVCDSCGSYKKLMLTAGKCICDFCATH